MRAFALGVSVVVLAFFPTLAIANVSCVQTQLAELGFAPGPVDGALGRRTREAAETVAGQAGLPLPPLTDETSPEWCTALEAFAATPAAATVFAESEKSKTATP